MANKLFQIISMSDLYSLAHEFAEILRVYLTFFNAAVARLAPNFTQHTRA